MSVDTDTRRRRAERRRLASNEFRDIIGRFASGVTVITAAARGQAVRHDGERRQLALARPADAARLPEQDVHDRPGDRRRPATSRSTSSPRTRPTRRCGSPARATSSPASRSSCGAAGEPLLEDALANLECRVVEEVTGGTHSVFLAEVEHATGPPGRAAGVLPRPVRPAGAQAGRRGVPRHPGEGAQPRAAGRRAAQPRRGRRARRRAARLGLPRAHEADRRGARDPHGRRPVPGDAADASRA